MTRHRYSVVTLLVLAVVAVAIVGFSGSAGAEGPPSGVVVSANPSGHPPPHADTPAAKELKRRGYLVPDENAYARGKQARGGAGRSAARSVPAAPLVSWQGQSDHSVTPPDTTGAIGTTRYVELINLRYGIYDRSGNLLDSGSLATLTGDPGNLTDPQVIWDPDTHRFYYVVLDFGSNNLEIGFSKTDSPSGAADWCKYDVDFGYGSNVPDYPKLGDTKDFLLVGVNVFNQFNNYVGADVDWLTKPPAGTTCPLLSSFLKGVKQNLLNAGGGSQAFTPVPPNQEDSSSTGWVVSASAYDADTQLQLFQVTKNGDGTANIAGVGTALTVPGFTFPPNAPQPGAPVVDTLDGRLTQAVSAIDPNHGGGVGIWTQHTVAGGAGSEVRWYEINPSAHSLYQSGTVSSGSLYTFNGAVSSDRVVNGATNAFGGSMVLGFNTTSSSAFPAIQSVSKALSGPQSAFQLVKQSNASENDFSCYGQFGPPCRWGDYSAASPDPAASTSGTVGQVWLANQWVTAGSSSSDVDSQTWIWSESPPAPTITSFSPAVSPSGSSVTLTGTNFTGASAVTLALVPASFHLDSSTQITATVPAGVSYGRWRVTTPAGTALNPLLFTATPPQIDSFSPGNGPAGSTVTLTGSGFYNVSQVTLANVNASFSVDSPTQIHASVPAGVEYGRWRVVTPFWTAADPTLFTAAD